MTKNSPECKAHFSEAFDRSKVVSAGSTAIIERLPCGHVRKVPYPDASPRERSISLRDIKREHDVYLRIASQPHFLEMVDFSPKQGLVLQGMPDDTLRGYLELQGPLISRSQRLSWAYSISTALHKLHTAGIIHGDLKPENILLDERAEVYLIDFSGSGIDGQQGSAWESTRFFMPRSKDSDSTVQTDLFALGSTLYEIFTGTQPYCDLADGMVEELFQKGEFPNLDLVICGFVIKSCWEGTINHVDEVITALWDQLSISNGPSS